MLRLAIAGRVILPFRSLQDSYQHVHAVRRDRRQRRNSCEQENPISTWVGNAGKTLQNLACFCERQRQRRSKIFAKLILDSSRNFFDTFCAQLGHHASRPEGRRELRRLYREQSRRFNPHQLVQVLPSLLAGSIACRIATMPPHQKFIWICRERWLLRTVKLLEFRQYIGNGSPRLSHSGRDVTVSATRTQVITNEYQEVDTG